MKSIAQLVTGVDYEFTYLALHNRIIHIPIKYVKIRKNLIAFRKWARWLARRVEFAFALDRFLPIFFFRGSFRGSRRHRQKSSRGAMTVRPHERVKLRSWLTNVRLTWHRQRETRFERSNRILAPELRGYVRRKVRHARTYTPGERERERNGERRSGADIEEICIARSNGNVVRWTVITRRFFAMLFVRAGIVNIVWIEKDRKGKDQPNGIVNARVAFILEISRYDFSRLSHSKT